MSNQEVAVAKFTRREFREALDAGKFGTAIIPTGSNEQHLEHLAMEYDIRAATYVATEAARRLYPDVVVNVPMAVGISEHHMIHKGTVTAKPGSWLAVLFDAVESLVRHGVNNVLILNGHGGNEAPMMGILRQWQLFFQLTAPEANVQFHSYWNLSREIAERHCTSRVPGHAGEYETAMAMVICPENIRHDAMSDQENQEPMKATEELGRVLVDAAVQKTVEHLKGMIDATNREIQPHVYSREMHAEQAKK